MRLHIPFTRFRLANGLNVIVHRDVSLPVASVNLWYHVGSKNEAPGHTGFAHLFEHVMFEGSALAPEGAFDHLLEGAGGVNNGSTSNDRTNYWENLPANALELALWLEADRMGYLLETMTQDKLDLQRDVVKNERRESVDNQPYGRAFEAVYERLYPAAHPYHWPVIGSMEDLSAATLEDVKAFFRTYYAPNNASLSIAGDVDVDEVRRLVELYFGPLPAGPAVPPVVVPDAALPSDLRVVLEDDVQLPRLYVAWHSAAVFTEDDAVLDVLASVLADGKGSRLHKRLVYQDQNAQDVGAFQHSQELAGSFWIVATAKQGESLADVEAALREELGRVADGGVESVELRRAVNGVETSFIRSLERVGGFGGKADRLNEYHFLAGSPDFVEEDLARYRAVTEEDLAAAARRYLTEAPAVWLSVVPRGRRDLAAGEETALLDRAGGVGKGAPAPWLDRASAVPEPAGHDAPTLSPSATLDRVRVPEVGPPPDMAYPEVEEYRLGNGMRVVLWTRSALPLVSLELQFRGGAAGHPAAQAGLAALTADMLDEGTTSRTALEIADAVDILGATLTSSTGYDAGHVRLSVLREKLPEALDVVADIVMRPTFPEAELTRVRRERLQRILQRSSEPAALADEALVRVLYGEDHPYGVPLLGTRESLEGLTRADVEAFHRARYTPAQATLVVAGDIRRDELYGLVSRTFAGWEGAGVDVPPPPAPEARQALGVYVVDKPGAAQSEVRVGAVSTDRRTPDFYPLTVLNTVLGGSFTSRLNMKLREEKGYTYGAGSGFDLRRSPGPFEAGAAVATPVTADAVTDFLREMEGLVGEPVPPEELTRARSYLTLRLPQRFESVDDVVRRLSELVLHDLPLDFYRGFVAGVEGVDADAVARAARRYLTVGEMAVVVAGDRARVEESLRALGLGPVVVLDAGAPTDDEPRRGGEG